MLRCLLIVCTLAPLAHADPSFRPVPDDELVRATELAVGIKWDRDSVMQLARLGGKVNAALKAKRFDQATRLMDAAWKAGPGPGTVTCPVTELLKRLGTMPDLLKVWGEAKTPTAHRALARAWSEVLKAWKARGSGFAPTVKPEGWKGFRKHLTRARGHLERAKGLAPKRALPLAWLILVGRGLGDDEAAVKALFDQAVRLEPAALEVYQERMTYLAPKWHGDEQRFWAFVRGIPREGVRAQIADFVLIRAHLAFPTRGIQAHFRQPKVRDEVLAALDRLLKACKGEAFPVQVRLDMAKILKEPKESRKPLLRRRALHSAPRAAHRLATRYLKSRDLLNGFMFEFRAAMMGQPAAATHLGIALLQSLGVKRNAPLAHRWFAYAASRGMPLARTYQAMMLLRGDGVTADPKRGIELIQLSAKEGEPKAMCELAIQKQQGKLVAKDPKGCFKLMKRCVAKRYPAGYTGLATCYQHGLGVKKDPKRAAKTLRKGLKEVGPRPSLVRALKALLGRHPELRRPGDPN